MIYANNVKRRPYCNGKYAKELWYNGQCVYEKLPYTPQEYIQSSGTQYINTMAPGNAATKIVFDGCVVSGDTCLFGARQKNGVNQFNIQCIGSGQYRTSWGGNGSNSTQAQVLIPFYKTNGRCTFILDRGKTYVGGTQYTNITAAWSDSLPKYDIYAVGAMNTGGVPSNTGSVRCYSMQIYENDVLACDMVPCLDSNNIACMYDKIGSQFYYNAGTGVFISA